MLRPGRALSLGTIGRPRRALRNLDAVQGLTLATIPDGLRERAPLPRGSSASILRGKSKIFKMGGCIFKNNELQLEHG